MAAASAAGADYNAADAELNRVYNQVLKTYSSDHEFIEKLRESQRAWIKFRDAQLEALYPKADKRGEYGSEYPTCAADALAELTVARTKQLQRWLDGVEEGDVCAGSVRVKGD
jgi:uncharacterized protein YecT (DUF1311 family)